MHATNPSRPVKSRGDLPFRRLPPRQFPRTERRGLLDALAQSGEIGAEIVPSDAATVVDSGCVLHELNILDALQGDVVVEEEGVGVVPDVEEELGDVG